MVLGGLEDKDTELVSLRPVAQGAWIQERAIPGKQISRFCPPLPFPHLPGKPVGLVPSAHSPPWATAAVTSQAQRLPHPDGPSLSKPGKGISSGPGEGACPEGLTVQNGKWGPRPSLGLAFPCRGCSTGQGRRPDAHASLPAPTSCLLRRR